MSEGSGDSSVDIGTGYDAIDFCLLLRILQNGLAAHPGSYPTRIGVKRPGREASTDVKNVWSHTSNLMLLHAVVLN
jgi:hypothetical protein